MLRLSFGLWAVARARRRARLIADAALLRLVQELRTAMGCRRGVAVCETHEVTSAATAGWLRPLVFLPTDWRTWTEDERRAVLAHELAHVRRWDYLIGVLVALGQALHFYHPLVRWLTGRLQLEQELAADEVGARFAGGRGPYLRALARLALRQDGRTLAGPGRTFLSARRTLMRRIQMLRTKDSAAERSPSWPGRAAVLLLLAVAVGASGLRATGPQAAAAPPAAPPETPAPGASQPPAVAAVEAAPFDLSAVPSYARGVCAIRPVAVFGQAGMKKYAETADKALRLFFKEGLGLDGPALPSVADIDQVVGTLTLGPDPKNEGNSSLTMDLRLLRTTRDFDWKKFFAAMFPKAVEVRGERGSYYRVLGRDVSSLLSGGSEKAICYHVIDARTVVIGSEEDMRRRVSGEKAAPPTHAWDADWKAVERDLFAVAVDGRDKTWLQQRSKPEDPVSVAFTAVAEKTAAVACGLSAGDGLNVTVIARCSTAKEVAFVFRRSQEMMTEVRAAVAKERSKDSPEDAADASIRALLTADWKVSRQPTGGECNVGWRCHCALTLSELVEALVAGNSSE
jgi:hypothetical protein